MTELAYAETRVPRRNYPQAKYTLNRRHVSLGKRAERPKTYKMFYFGYASKKAPHTRKQYKREVMEENFVDESTQARFLLRSKNTYYIHICAKNALHLERGNNQRTAQK